MINKRKPIRSNKITQSARNESCTFRGPTCNNNNETTVFCHVDKIIAGKGMGTKSDDIFGFYGCSSCHLYYSMKGPASNTAENQAYIDQFLLRAMIITQRRLFDKGFLIVKLDKK